MTNYYNEIDPFAAAMLRNLIAAGHIAPGIVDERRIEDVRPDELAGYTQCHFFAGIGVWSKSLRSAGWLDDRPVWTGSCPCQPFSAAGKGAGFADERHLWPTFYHLIAQCEPTIIFGEQVAGKAVDPWIDLVHADLEALGYAFGSVPFPSAGVGAPHIRDRNYWVANAQCERDARGQRSGSKPGASPVNHECSGAADRLDNTDDTRPQGYAGDDGATGWQRPVRSVASSGLHGGLADTLMQQRQDGQPGICDVDDATGWIEGAATTAGLCNDLRPGPTNGLWADADWLFCRDGKWRPVEPGTFPLAHGSPSRVGRLRAYGNAINAIAAQAFIESVM